MISLQKKIQFDNKHQFKWLYFFSWQYSSKPGEKLYVVVPKPKPMTSSPFVPEKVPEKTLPPVNAVVPMNIKSRGVLATSEPPASSKTTPTISDVPEITIKTELVIDNDFGNNNQKSPRTNNSLRLAFFNM